ncbi:MAG: phage holin family protein [Solirubrobacterales bacterium]|nr:phage holin family protein [Solirubrobacterales bacterium]
MPNNNGNNGSDSIATALTEVSDKLSRLIQDEIELAKLEVATKVSSLARGGVAVAVGAVFGVFALIFGLMTVAWAVAELTNYQWIGFGAVFVLLLVLTLGSFLFAWRKLKVGAPTPKLAIAEGKEIQKTVTGFGASSTTAANGNGHHTIPAGGDNAAWGSSKQTQTTTTPEKSA